MQIALFAICLLNNSVFRTRWILAITGKTDVAKIALREFFLIVNTFHITKISFQNIKNKYGTLSQRTVPHTINPFMKVFRMVSS